MSRVLRATGPIACVALLAGCSTLGLIERDLPGTSIHRTLDNAIRVLEAGDCVGFAVDFLSPIRLAQIEDREAYEERMSCTQDNRQHIDAVILALRMARRAEPVSNGVIATIDMSGAGTHPERFVLVRYTDGRWYFADL